MGAARSRCLTIARYPPPTVQFKKLGARWTGGDGNFGVYAARYGGRRACGDARASREPLAPADDLAPPPAQWRGRRSNCIVLDEPARCCQAEAAGAPTGSVPPRWCAIAVSVWATGVHDLTDLGVQVQRGMVARGEQPAFSYRNVFHGLSSLYRYAAARWAPPTGAAADV